MVERYTVTVFVVGSSPILHTIISVRLKVGQEPLKLLIVVRAHD